MPRKSQIGDVNSFAKEKSDWETERNANRNRQRSTWLNHLESGNDQLADRMLANNIGDKRYTKQANRKLEPIKSSLNHALDEFFETENPREIVIEDLTWSKWNSCKSPGVQANRKLEPIKSSLNHALDEFFETENPREIVIEDLTWSKWNSCKSPGVNRRLSSWMKGYLDERLIYKAEQHNCKVTYVNPAYTSQLYPKCHHLGIRQGESFTCSNCGHQADADLNAAKNILDRKKDTEITVYTSAKDVKKIILRRIEEKQQKQDTSKKPKKAKKTKKTNRNKRHLRNQ